MRMLDDKPQAEVAVLFKRPWFGEGTKRFVGKDDIEVGFQLGYFLVALYKGKGRLLELVMRRADGTTEVIPGRAYERSAGIKREVLS